MSETPGSAEPARTARAAERGDRDALDALLPRVYDELRAVARRAMARERDGHTLQTTAVVHEAYVRLCGQHQLDPADRVRFFAAAAATVRRVLVDHARSHQAVKRGAGCAAVTLSGIGADEPNGQIDQTDILDVHEAVEALAALDPREGRIVELRFFGGLSREDVAQVLGISVRLVDQEWAHARAWLSVRLASHLDAAERPAVQ